MRLNEAPAEACACPPVEGDLADGDLAGLGHLARVKILRLHARSELEGPRVCYCLSPRALRRLKALVGAL